MRLVIQIPCFNERESLPATLAAIPEKIPGVDQIDVLIIDDGSVDGTSDVARSCGVRSVIRSENNQGLARAFATGLDAALRMGADIVVNTDADGQYPGEAIPELIAPILHGEADMVLGDRGPSELAHFSPLKRWLQWVGSWVVRGLSGTEVPDATSGFRAFSREAALRLNVVSEFTYTLETLIQAGKKQLSIAYVPVRVNQVTRPSRLFRGARQYVTRSVGTLVRIYSLYEPLRVFGMIGIAMLGVGSFLGVRFIYDYVTSGGQGHVQSLILAAVLLLAGFQSLLIGLVADLIASSRRLIEDLLLRVRRLELGDSED